MAEFKVRDKQTGEVFTIREKEQPQEQPTQQPEQQGQGVVGQLLSSTGNIAKGIINPPYRIASRAIQGVQQSFGGQGTTFRNPLTGDVVEPYTSETKLSEPIGLGLQGAATMLGPAVGGAAYGAGSAMEEGKSGGAITGQALLGGLLGRVAGTMSGQYKMPTIKNDKLAGKVVNSLIKPKHKDYLFGKNPGQGVAKEGIIATSMDDLAFKVEQRNNELNNAIKVIRNTPENINKTVNLSNIKKPLIESVIELRKAPKVHSAEITNLENALSDLGKLEGGDLSKLSVSKAYEIKGIISKMQDWNKDTKSGANLNKALKQVYGFVDKKIDNVIPELEELNSRTANLISAKQAIKSRVEVLESAEPANWSGLLNLPFAAYRSVPAKTTLGKLIANSYKKVK